MERSGVKFQKSAGDWIVSVFMLVIPIPLFVIFYPRTGFESGNKGLIYLLCFALFFFIYGFHKALLTPYSIEFQKDESLVMQSVLFPKTLAVQELQSVRITESIGKNGSGKVVYEMILKDGDSLTLPALTHMAGFIEKLALLYPSIEIKDERLRHK
jgi:hypothetical protein